MTPAGAAASGRLGQTRVVSGEATAALLEKPLQNHMVRPSGCHKQPSAEVRLAGHTENVAALRRSIRVCAPAWHPSRTADAHKPRELLLLTLVMIKIVRLSSQARP